MIRFTDGSDHALAQALADAALPLDVVGGGSTKAEVIAAFNRDLNLPGWCGHNLDALAECLATYYEGERAAATLVWQPDPEWIAADPRAYAGVLGVIEEVLGEAERAAAGASEPRQDHFLVVVTAPEPGRAGLDSAPRP